MVDTMFDGLTSAVDAKTNDTIDSAFMENAVEVGDCNLHVSYGWGKCNLTSQIIRNNDLYWTLESHKLLEFKLIFGRLACWSITGESTPATISAALSVHEAVIR